MTTAHASPDRVSVLARRYAILRRRHGSLLDAEGAWARRYDLPSITDPAIDRLDPRPVCAAAGCERRPAHWGLCVTHYGKVKRTGPRVGAKT